MYLECAECNKHYDVNQAIYRCLDHNYPLLVKYDYEKIATSINKYTFENRPWNLWRYKEVLPIKNKSNIVSLGEGGTVLIRSKHLAKNLVLKNYILKMKHVILLGHLKIEVVASVFQLQKKLD